MIRIMLKLGQVGSYWVLLGAQHWVRVGSGLEKFNPDPGWVGFWVETFDPSWVMRKSNLASPTLRKFGLL